MNTIDLAPAVEDGPARLRTLMPAMFRHEGTWKGVYRHYSADADLIDEHDAQVICEFPTSGPHVYIQHNLFRWPDGTTKTAVLPAVLRQGKLWWDVATFSGWGWETDFGIILLNLTRKDDPGAVFFEMITLGDGDRSRARTWQWFKNGTLFRRTLCDETRV